MNSEAWHSYQLVNEAFGNRISDEAVDGDLIWVATHVPPWYLDTKANLFSASPTPRILRAKKSS